MAASASTRTRPFKASLGKLAPIVMTTAFNIALMLSSILLPSQVMALERFTYDEGYVICVDYYIRSKFNNSMEAWEQQSKRSRQGIKVQAHAQCK